MTSWSPPRKRAFGLVNRGGLWGRDSFRSPEPIPRLVDFHFNSPVLRGFLDGILLQESSVGSVRYPTLEYASCMTAPPRLSGARPPHCWPVQGDALLKALDAQVIARLHLRPIAFELEHELEYPGNLISHLYFIEEGMASMTTTFRNGGQVEVGMFGYKSVVGVSALMGSKRSLPEPGIYADCGERLRSGGGRCQKRI